MALHRFDASVLNREEIAPQVVHLTLSSPSAFTFKAGQFCSLSFDVSGKTVKRSYSIGSSPSKHGSFDLCVKLVEGGTATPILFNLQEGDLVKCQGPLGAFTIKDEKKPIILIGTGTGVAPFRGILHDLLERKHSGRIVLMAGYRHEDEVLYDKEFSKLAQMHNNFLYFPVVSRPSSGFRGAIGRVQQLIEAHVHDYTSDFYVCGLKEMVDDVKKLLESKGAMRVFFEKYD